MSNLTDFIGGGGGGTELVLLLLDSSVTGTSLEVYVSDSKNYLAVTEVIASSTAMNAVMASSTAMNAVMASSTAMNAVAASSTAMNAVAASSTAMASMMNSQIARVALFNSSTAQYSIRNSTEALSYLATIKTSLAISAPYTEYTEMTARDCFVLAHGGLDRTTNKTKNYRHITDGISSAEIVGDNSTAGYNNRFMSGLYMYLYNASGSPIKTADVVYFD